jgi:peptidoglycan-N-acetylglucosamine deacetylase
MNFLSVDLEDWHTSAYLRNYVNKSNFQSRIEFSTEKILHLFSKKKVKATFFVLGSVAESHPELIKIISDEGHEIASHGFSHTPLWHLSAEEFKKELQQTNELLSGITSKKVIGFRAPYASLNLQTKWAVDILKEQSFLYDSSIFPMKTPLYGMPNTPLNCYRISSENLMESKSKNDIIEVPFTIFSAKGIKVPCTGGIYGRFLPEKIWVGLLKNIELIRPLNIYFHPWEIDDKLPRINVPVYNRLVSYYNIKNYLNKIEVLLNTFAFDSFENILFANKKTEQIR